MAALICILSLSARRAWIEISLLNYQYRNLAVALRKESVDRNMLSLSFLAAVGVALRKESVDRNARKIRPVAPDIVALRKESVDRNTAPEESDQRRLPSLSARRAWIEISYGALDGASEIVALRKESVDRNLGYHYSFKLFERSLSARRAWIEIL